jgi:hypothetical protein
MVTIVLNNEDARFLRTLLFQHSAVTSRHESYTALRIHAEIDQAIGREI